MASYHPMPSRNLFLIIQSRPKIKVDKDVELEAVVLSFNFQPNTPPIVKQGSGGVDYDADPVKALV